MRSSAISPRTIARLNFVFSAIEKLRNEFQEMPQLRKQYARSLTGALRAVDITRIDLAVEHDLEKYLTKHGVHVLPPEDTF